MNNNILEIINEKYEKMFKEPEIRALWGEAF